MSRPSEPAARRGRRIRSEDLSAWRSTRAIWENSFRTWRSRDGPESGGRPFGGKARLPVKRFERDLVKGWLHEPAAPCDDAIALTHGAGSNCEAPLLRALAEAFCASGWPVLRYDL